jgi:hypothetical protein
MVQFEQEQLVPRVGGQMLQVAVQGPAQGLAQVVAGQHGRADGIPFQGGDQRDQLPQELVAGAEAVVEGRQRHPGLGDDGPGGACSQAVTSHHPQRRL